MILDVVDVAEGYVHILERRIEKRGHVELCCGLGLKMEVEGVIIGIRRL